MENKRELPKPVQEDRFSKTWLREELDDLGGPESYIWKQSIEGEIAVALADSIKNPKKTFYIDFSYGDQPGPSMTRRKMDDLFKPLDLPDEEDSPEFRDLVQSLSEEIWEFFADETPGYKFFQFRAAAGFLSEIPELLEDGWIED